MTDKELFYRATKARVFAYAPYSEFLVGAAVLARDGRVFTGTNVENASYGLTLCAERSALAHAVAEGVLPGDVEVVAVYAAIPNAPSCGACLQWLTEFQVERIIFMKGGEPRSFLLKELLPEAFAL